MEKGLRSVAQSTHHKRNTATASDVARRRWPGRGTCTAHKVRGVPATPHASAEAGNDRIHPSPVWWHCYRVHGKRIL
eukprot:gene18661-biopygen18979